MIRPVFAVDIGKVFNAPFDTPGEIISVLLPNVFTIAGVILLILLIGGGFAVILNAGKGQQEGVAQGKQAITASLIGFLVIIAAYWLVQIISTITGLKILNP